MAKKFFNWLKQTVVNAVDPEREKRIAYLNHRIFQDLKSRRQAFRLDDLMRELAYPESEVQEACKRVFTKLLENAWKDGNVTEEERKNFDWIEGVLQLSKAESHKVQEEFAIEQFRACLGQGLEQGELSPEIVEKLSSIAGSVDVSVSAFSRKHFHKEGQAFLRSTFIEYVENGTLTPEEWTGLLGFATVCGIRQAELLNLVAQPARQHVEHVLADAKSDEQLNDREKAQIEWLLTTLKLDETFENYVRKEMEELQRRYEISLGRLPSLQPPRDLGLKSGELLHAVCPSRLVVVRILKSGPAQDVHGGELYLLDNRAIFRSDTKGLEFSYRKVIASRIGKNWIEFQLNGKPVWAFHFGENEPIVGVIFKKALAMANQTETMVIDLGRTRQIPRDVRQRVWQKYGGRCAECGATDYLEFDHIIPFSKGGSNHDGNIQLLCRRCNLKKSDHI